MALHASLLTGAVLCEWPPPHPPPPPARPLGSGGCLGGVSLARAHVLSRLLGLRPGERGVVGRAHILPRRRLQARRARGPGGAEGRHLDLRPAIRARRCARRPHRPARKQGRLPRAMLSPADGDGEGDAKAFSSEAFPTPVYSAPSQANANAVRGRIYGPEDPNHPPLHERRQMGHTRDPRLVFQHSITLIHSVINQVQLKTVCDRTNSLTLNSIYLLA